ncbi:hypothetical protein DLE01_27975 [Streptomyces sp. FT05W]|nr:hypothetical protein DLE01_27975 [Streptomyces sp. FT05W]
MRVRSAHVSTLGANAVDAFYVTDPDGEPLAPEQAAPVPCATPHPGAWHGQGPVGRLSPRAGRGRPPPRACRSRRRRRGSVRGSSR